MYVKREFGFNNIWFKYSLLLGLLVYMQEKFLHGSYMSLFYLNFPMASVGQVTPMKRFANLFFVAFNYDHSILH